MENNNYKLYEANKNTHNKPEIPTGENNIDDSGIIEIENHDELCFDDVSDKYIIYINK